MIDRYTLAPFDTIWSEQNKFKTWLTVELEACKSMERVGLVPQGTHSKLQLHSKDIIFDSDRISEIESKTKHDVIAFLSYLEEVLPSEARWLHFGMTSSDLLDTSFALILCEASFVLSSLLDNLTLVLEAKVKEFATTPMMGRSHGMSAEPITLGVMLAGHLAEFKRNQARLHNAWDEIRVGKISGAVGVYAHLSPQIEQETLTQLALEPETVSTQIVPRDRHAVYFMTLALIAASIERLATNIRHLQRTEVGELQESFGAGQKGSSAMPHKKNPITSELLCGLSRMVRSYVTPALENIPLWHERDISHSSVERIIAPDAISLVGYMLTKAADLIKNLHVNSANMEKNIENSRKLYATEAVLLKLVQKGFGRQKAYELVQRVAMQTYSGIGDFQENLLNDPAIRILDDDFSDCFNLEHQLRHAEEIIGRV